MLYIHHNYGELLPPITTRINAIFHHALSVRYRNFFLRFDVNFPDDGLSYPESALFREFMRAFVFDLTRKGFGDVFYLATREKVSADRGLHDRVNGVQHGHYHVFMILDGKQTHSIYAHMIRARELWGRQLNLHHEAGGYINYRSPAMGNGIMLYRPAPDAYGLPSSDRSLVTCLRQAYYLAKARSKHGYLKHGHRWSSTSNIPPGPHWVEPVYDPSLSADNEVNADELFECSRP